MSKKAMVLGYFGYENNQLDGQTVKTRNIYDLLKTKEGNTFSQVDYYDTQSFKSNKLLIFKAFKSIRKSDIVYYLPAQNNLKFLFPFIFIFCRILNIQLHYIVVGGWLVEFVKNKPLHKKLLKNIKTIYPETQQLVDELKDNYNFNNVKQLHNFRIHNFIPTLSLPNDIIRIVFMARVTKHKGIDTIFNLAQYISINNLNNAVIIDIYGPISKEESNHILKEISRYSILNYKGIIEPNDVNVVLNTYDFLIFPTRYPGEGFPGTILDAYISGIPVIASNWRHIPEFIDNGSTGFLYNVEDEDDFFRCVHKLIIDKDLILNMKKNASNKSKQYSFIKAWEIIKP